MKRPGTAPCRDWMLALWWLAATLAFGTHCAGADLEKSLTALEKACQGVRRFVLDDGMVCLIKEDRSAPVVAVQIWIGTGSIHEGDYLGAGISHYVEHMIFKGTTRRGPNDISAEINNAGGFINAYTQLDRTVIHADLPSSAWRVGIDVLADAVMNSTFPEDESRREKDVTLREFAMGNDDPERVLNKLSWATAFAVHPYRFPIIGHEDIFATLGRADLTAYFSRRYVPDNMITVVVGDVDAAEVRKYLAGVFQPFKRRKTPPVTLPAEPRQMAPRFARQTGEYEVSRLEWGYHAVPLNHEDAPVLDVLAAVVGQGRSSILSVEVKERKGLVHEIEAWSFTPREPGIFGFSATFDPGKEGDLLAAIQEQVDSWHSRRFSSDEVRKAIRILLSQELSGLETMSGQASSYASGEFYANAPSFSAAYLRRLSEVTPASLQSVVRKYLSLENRTVAILSPGPDPAYARQAERPAIAGEAQRFDTPNGIPVLVREDHRLPFIYLCAAFRGGMLFEDASNNGITKLMSDLLIRGTRKMSSEEVARRSESLGGLFTPFSGRNSFGLQARCLSTDVDEFTEIFADCLLNPVFGTDEIQRQKVLQIAAVEQQYEKPMFLAQEALNGVVFTNHPYRFSPLGTKESVAAVTRENLLLYHQNHVTASNMVVAIFGDTTPGEARKLAARLFSKVPRGRALRGYAAEWKPSLPVRVEQRSRKEQAVVLVGFPGVDMRDPRRDALEVIETAMNGMASDLAVEIRENRGLAYYVGAYQQVGLGAGLFTVYAGTRRDRVGEVEALIGKEIARTVASGIRKEELDRAKKQIAANHDMSLQDNLSLAMDCALNELYGLGWRYGFDVKRRMEAVTLESVRSAAVSVLSTNRQAASILLPESEPAPADHSDGNKGGQSGPK